MKTFTKFLNESQDSLDEGKIYKVTDFPKGTKFEFNDGEVWLVVEPGKRMSQERRPDDCITAKPFNDLAKKNNISLSIDLSMEYVNKNIKSIIK